jgi:hypothetical protein
MDVQRQIKENSEELQSMVKDLYAWEDEIKKKDQELKQLPKPKKTLPPIRGTTTTNESTTSPAPKTDVESNKKLSIEAKEKVTNDHTLLLISMYSCLFKGQCRVSKEELQRSNRTLH